MQVFHPALIHNFPPYKSGGLLTDVAPVTETDSGQLYLSTPNVAREVRTRFNCSTLPGALTEDGNSAQGITNGTAGLGHFEHSIFYKDFLQGQVRCQPDVTCLFGDLVWVQLARCRL